MKSYGDNRRECNRPKWVKASEFCIIHISIYTLSDLVDLSNLIGGYLGLFNNIHFLASWIMCEVGVFPNFFRERSSKSRQNPRIDFL